MILMSLMLEFIQFIDEFRIYKTTNIQDIRHPLIK